MKRLALLPLAMLVFACNDSTLVQPEDNADLQIVAAARASRTVWTWQEEFVESLEEGYLRITPSGVLQLWSIENLWTVGPGDLEGEVIWRTTGNATVNGRTGEGTAPLTGTYDLTEPEVGGFECVGRSKLRDFNTDLIQESQVNCKGTGAFAGMHMKITGSNEANPGSDLYDMIGEVW